MTTHASHLGRPDPSQFFLPPQRSIINERPTYYRLPDRGSWNDYLNWFLTIIIDACKETTPRT